MKYLLFNGVVAAALIYLVAGDKIELTNPLVNEETAQAEIDDAVTGDAKVAYQQTVMETTKQVATATAARVANDVAERLIAGEKSENIPSVDVSVEKLMSEEGLTPLETEYVEVAPNYVIDEAKAVAGDGEPSLTEAYSADENITESPASTFQPVPQPAFELADGAQFMSVRERQKELDTIAQNMEFLFLSTQ